MSRLLSLPIFVGFLALTGCDPIVDCADSGNFWHSESATCYCNPDTGNFQCVDAPFPGSVATLDLVIDGEDIRLTLENISDQPLSIIDPREGADGLPRGVTVRFRSGGVLLQNPIGEFGSWSPLFLSSQLSSDPPSEVVLQPGERLAYGTTLAEMVVGFPVEPEELIEPCTWQVSARVDIPGRQSLWRNPRWQPIECERITAW